MSSDPDPQTRSPLQTDAPPPGASSRARSLVALAHRVGVEDVGLRTALGEIAEAAAGILGVDRAGIWLLQEEGEVLRCAALHDPRADAEGRGSIAREEAPALFEALSGESPLTVEDAGSDARTAGLRATYLEPAGVRAFLYAPIRRRGEVAGMISHEVTTGTRSWTDDDEQAAGMLADLVSRAMEARDRRSDERALRDSERRYRELFERNVAGVYRTTPDGEILEVNRACARMFGYDSPEELLEATDGRAALAYADPDDRERAVERLRSHGRLENHETRMRRSDGSTAWVLENAVLVEDPAGEGPVIEGTLIDITHRKRLEAELERMAYHDALTGLANRRLLAERAEKVLARARRNGEQAGMVYVDLARFKRINDTLGHAAGDRVLVEVGRRLGGAVRESDTVARVGGDEFAVLLAEVDGADGAARASERLARALEEPVSAGDRSVHVNARFGAALYPDHADGYDELLSAADHALTRTYAAGAPNVHLYVPDPADESGHELDLEEELRRALDREQLALFYQPIVRMGGSGQAEGAEALLRWHHPERGLLAAGEFIHLAERSPLVHRLDRWVIREAARQVGAWAREGGPSWVSVNLSAASLRDPELVDYVAEVLESEGLEGPRLVVELTERTAVRNPELVTASLRLLREMGVGVAIDDFGTGHSALAYLKTFPASLLKMDGFFIQGLDEDERQGDVARAIIRLGGAVGMRVTAERVESDHQRRWLEDVGCDLGQGFWIGEPVPPDQFAPTDDPDG